MTTKQKIIIVSVIIGIMFIAIFILVKSKSKDLDTTSDSTEYAVNNITTEATTEETTEDEVETTEETTEATPTDTTSVTFTYNTTKDKNADSKELSNRTISINGHLITFPTDYKTIANLFKLNPTKVSRELGTPTDATQISTTVDYYAEQENVGIIQFYFTPTEDNLLQNAICDKVVISGISETNEPLTSMALQGGITFGSSKQDILNVYGNITETNEGSDDGQDFTLVYEPDDKSHDKYTFAGKSGGLYQIILEFGTN